jgi:uncharacterized membrane protein YecN with MAPEG domain
MAGSAAYSPKMTPLEQLRTPDLSGGRFWWLWIIMVILVTARSPFHLRYLTLKLLLFRVKCLKACHLSLLHLQFAAQLLMLYAKWLKPLLHLRYLTLKRIIRRWAHGPHCNG